MEPKPPFNPSSPNELSLCFEVSFPDIIESNGLSNNSCWPLNSVNYFFVGPSSNRSRATLRSWYYAPLDLKFVASFLKTGLRLNWGCSCISWSSTILCSYVRFLTCNSLLYPVRLVFKFSYVISYLDLISSELAGGIASND